MISIYRIINLKTGKSYIGKTNKPIIKRLNEHVNNALLNTSNTKFFNSIRKYGKENFIIGAIVEGVPHYLWIPFEKYWINYYNTYLGNGYNSTPGGDGGHGLFGENHPSKRKEVREKISKSLIGKSNGNCSEETKKKMSEHWTNDRKIKQSEIIKEKYKDKTSNFYKEWYSSCQNYRKSLTKEERKEKFGHPGSKNCKSKIIEIYDNNHNLMFICNGNFKKVCEKNNLPFMPLWKSQKIILVVFIKIQKIF